MPRIPRNYEKTSFFHLMTQGINKKYIFEEKKDILYYIDTMKNLEEERNLKIIAYCIMNNHSHMLLNVKNVEELAKYMKSLNTKYAMHYNKIHNRVGYVFRDRYKSEGIYSEEQFYNCINYIYNNPVKAHICNNPAEYKYSNYENMRMSIENKKDILKDCYRYIDVDDSIKDDKNIISEYILKNNIEISELIEDNTKLKEIVFYLKQNTKMSYRRMEKQLGISREKLRRIFNNI